MPFLSDFQLLPLILRGAAGLLLGIPYGLLVWVVYYPITHLGLDYEHPGPLIPNTVEFAALANFMVALIAGVIAALVGLIIGLVGTRKRTAAVIGFIAGLVLLGINYIPLREEAVASSLRYIIALAIEAALFPFGLALMSVLVAAISAQLKRWEF